MTELLNRTYFNNTVQDYLISFSIIIAGVLILRAFRKVILNRLRKIADKTETKIDDLLVVGVQKYGLPILNFVVLYYGLHYLQFTERAQKVVDVSMKVIVIYFMVRLVIAFIQMSLEGLVRKQENGEEKIKQLKGVLLVINVVIWMLGLVFLFSNLGYDVTAVITGLGIGGIAIALAAQNILGDLFNYFVIFFDRPFEIGDFIVVDDKKGTVEYIGIKTTRLKSLSGEQLIFSNSDLTNSRIHNFKRMDRRRALFTIGVTYQTPAEQLRKIPGFIRKAIENQTDTSFDRSHFSSYGDFSLNFETVYFVESSEYNRYMDIQQSVNMELFEVFAKEGISFAYPTQTVFEYKLGTTSDKKENQSET